ncbi:MAG: hypothetical protein WAM27_06625 [Nitrososphaeraceae archaeon]|jgi:hypothetical protein
MNQKTIAIAAVLIATALTGISATTTFAYAEYDDCEYSIESRTTVCEGNGIETTYGAAPMKEDSTAADADDADDEARDAADDAEDEARDAADEKEDAADDAEDNANEDSTAEETMDSSLPADDTTDAMGSAPGYVADDAEMAMTD